jgi:4,5-dihydroxyphthalate decarboxylase
MDTNDEKTSVVSRQRSRREFLGMSATVAGAAGVLAVSGASELFASPTGESPNGTKKIPLKVAGYRHDRVEALIDGRVQVEGCDAHFEIAAIGDMNTDVFSGPQSREVTEIGLHPFMLAYANEGFRDYSLLPLFPLRVFRHRSIFIRTDRGIEKPEDLRGKRIATPGFSSTSLTWLRGILHHEFGVAPGDIQWVVSSADSSAEAAGKVSKQENIIPDGLKVSRGPEGKDESDLLEAGDVDALLHAAEPRAYVQAHPKVARLFGDYRRAEQAYYTKTDIFPIMHAVAIRNDVASTYPWLPKAVFYAYSNAKKLMYGELKKLGWATISLPWIGQEIEDTRKLMGDNYWPYGIEPNRKVLETLFEYSHEQGLASRKLAIEDLFHPATLTLKDTVQE